MAKNMFQADLGNINTSAAEFTREGVVDSSAKYDNNLQTLMEVADVAYTKYSEYDASKQLKDMEKQQVQDALTYKTYKESEAKGGLGLEATISGLEQQKSDLLKSAKAEEEGVAVKLDEDIGRLRSALTNGNLSQAAYDIKVSSLVKQMSANKPWLASYVRQKAAEVTGVSKLYSSPELATIFQKQENDKEQAEREFALMKDTITKVAGITGNHSEAFAVISSGDKGAIQSFLNKEQTLINNIQDRAREADRIALELQKANLIDKQIDIQYAHILKGQQVAQNDLSMQNTRLSMQEKRLTIAEKQADANNKGRIKSLVNTSSAYLLNKLGTGDIMALYNDPTKALNAYGILQKELMTTGSVLNSLATSEDPLAKKQYKIFEDMISNLKSAAEGKTFNTELVKYQAEHVKNQSIIDADALKSSLPQAAQNILLLGFKDPVTASKITTLLEKRSKGETPTTEENRLLDNTKKQITSKINPYNVEDVAKIDPALVDGFTLFANLAKNPDYANSPSVVETFEPHYTRLTQDIMFFNKNGYVVLDNNQKFVPTKMFLDKYGKEAYDSATRMNAVFSQLEKIPAYKDSVVQFKNEVKPK